MTNFTLGRDELDLIETAAANRGALPLDSCRGFYHDSMQYLQTWGVFEITAPNGDQHYRLTDAGVKVAADHGWQVNR